VVVPFWLMYIEEPKKPKSARVTVENKKDRTSIKILLCGKVIIVGRFFVKNCFVSFDFKKS